LHKEKVGRIKTDAVQTYHARRGRALSEPGWCPAVERRRGRERARAEQEREQKRLTFAAHAADYGAWASAHRDRSWPKSRTRLSRILPVFGSRYLDEITTKDIERFLAALRDGDRPLSPASVNRYRALLSAMFKRAVRDRHVPANPVTGTEKLPEAGGRIMYLEPEEEQAIRDALPPHLRPVFTVSINTGLRWSEQIKLRWADIDLLAGTITVGQPKRGRVRHVPINSVACAMLVELGARRQRPDDPAELVFEAAYRTVARVFERAVKAAQAALSAAGKDAGRLNGYTWHGNRHTFASRLVMAGVDLRTVQELGGWKTLSMVQRYAHLARGHLAAAVELASGSRGAVELSRNYPALERAPALQQ